MGSLSVQCALGTGALNMYTELRSVVEELVRYSYTQYLAPICKISTGVLYMHTVICPTVHEYPYAVHAHETLDCTVRTGVLQLLTIL